MKLYVVGIACLSVAACATLPMPGPPKTPKPPSVVHDIAAVTPHDGDGAIMVTRDYQLEGMSCIHDVFMDDHLVAQLRPGERVTMYANPGWRYVGVSIHAEGSCEAADARFPLQVVANATTKVRVKADAYHGLKIEATSY